MAYDGSPILTDNNGKPVPQIWDGTEWVAYEGQAFDLENLVATETTLDTRLNSLETKMDTLLNSQDTDNNLNVKQTGSIVEDEELIARDVYTTNQTITLTENDIPDRANGAIFSCIILGVTGTFGTDEGLIFDFNNSFESVTSGRSFLESESPAIDQDGNINTILSTNIGDLSGYTASRNRDTSIIPSRVFPPIRLRMRISGTFNTGEGFDSKVIAQWFK